MNKIDSYLNEIYIQEDMQELLKDFSNFDKTFLGKIKASIDQKKPVESMRKIKKLAPGFNAKRAQAKIDEVVGLKISEYPKLKTRATIVVQNSISGVSKQMAEVAGTFLAVSALFVKKGQEGISLDKNLQSNLKVFVTKVRKFGEDYDDEKEEKTKMRPSDYADLSVAWVIVVMSTALAFGIGAGVYVALKVVSVAIAAMLPWVMKTATVTILCLIVLMALFWLKAVMGV